MAWKLQLPTHAWRSPRDHENRPVLVERTPRLDSLRHLNALPTKFRDNSSVVFPFQMRRELSLLCLRRIACLVAVTLISATPLRAARAGWEYTRWGMSPREVAAASRGAASLDSGRPEEALEDYQIGDVAIYVLPAKPEPYKFRVTFHFLHGHLAQVKLDLSGASVNRCFALQIDLKRFLGRPRSGNELTHLETWEDRGNNNDIASWRVDSGSSATCDIGYGPLFGPYRNPGKGLGLTPGEWLGYLRCSPSRLQTCKDSNELFYGLPDRKGYMKDKSEFPRVLRRFIGPAEYDNAAERLVGPGLVERLPEGGWLFAGFTPHDATDKGVVVFDAKGKILAIGELGVDARSPCSGTLTVFSRNAAPEKTRLASLTDWAREAVAGVYGCQSSNSPAVSLRELVAKGGGYDWRAAP